MYILFLARILSILLLLSPAAFGHETAANSADIGLTEKLGAYLPLDAVFRDERGNRVRLNEVIDRPTIIAPVYLHCVHECPLLLNGLASALGRMDFLTPGRDFKVVALSFDDRDTPTIAAEKKPNYLKSIGKPFPADAWTFLTGDASDIRKFTESIGFRFQRDGEHDFSHPIALVIVGRTGRIVRYLPASPWSITFPAMMRWRRKMLSWLSFFTLECFSTCRSAAK